MILEESRVEAAHLTRRPQDRPWLRAMIQSLILSEITLDPTPTDPTDLTGGGFGGVAAGRSRTVAAQAAGLVLARVDAHVLTEDETRPVRDAVTAVLGADLVAELAQGVRGAKQAAE